MSTNNIKFEQLNRESTIVKYPKVITVISAKRCARIQIDDVEYIEQDGRVLHIYTSDRDYSAYESIDSVANMLSPEFFFRPLKGLIVNFNHVKEVSCTTIYFESGQMVNLGRNKMCLTKAAFKKYIYDFPSWIAQEEGLHVAE